MISIKRCKETKNGTLYKVKRQVLPIDRSICRRSEYDGQIYRLIPVNEYDHISEWIHSIEESLRDLFPQREVSSLIRESFLRTRSQLRGNPDYKHGENMYLVLKHVIVTDEKIYYQVESYGDLIDIDHIDIKYIPLLSFE